MPAPDLDFVRAQFPAFSEPDLQRQAFFENAGGSYVCRQVIDRLGEYYRRLKVQPYYAYAASTEAGQWMDAAHERLAVYLGVGADEVHFGPSTSQNSYVLAQALGHQLRPGDEIVVSQQEHEANSGVWRRLADRGAVIREWPVDAGSGLLDPGALDGLLSERTRLVAFTQCSNIVGALNPVAAITAKIRRAGAISVVDGVAGAPHGLPDVAALGADIYLCSLYKTFGPHQGLMVVRRPLLERLHNEGHYFNAAAPRKRLVPAGPDHAQVAAACGIAMYLDALDAHNGGADDAGRPQRVRECLRAAEQPLIAELLDALGARKDLRLIGPAQAERRAATIAVVPRDVAPGELVTRLAAQGVMAASGHFYAVRLLEALCIDPARGVLRLSFLHYTSPADVRAAIEALDRALTS
ncbi:aminotransferase class V-fold PLP-dependent enzyme [Sinimarinibacterium flocculans]|uniref:Cysteine desulfurase family protein (TIGR01976 family) n=1 Tax=Sinimarinibacterium flocculans TaxID=985250 RepID=A0A318EC83_9GAMM|nr:aminotransferase class V-fold PLP-dependent enzyme [Sinimarinibacterium flocculans]PXV69732.1 cysteine desulfurase family protein (TIGR01976 family) [Sinimarinibacterium flocculans]